MSTASPSVKQRKKNKAATPLADGITNGDVDAYLEKAQAKVETAVKSDWEFKLACGIITILAFVTRFYGISHPDQVVFDEVHFGKFASHYLQRTYFFDVHPPFGKLLFAFAGWFVGYKGDFLFENIGDSYIKNKVPYVAYRSMPALMGSLTVTTVFMIMWESGYSLPACLLATALVLFDNAHIAQTRLILLDATLVLFMALSIFCYVRFYKLRHVAFSRKWWKWLLLTGISLSSIISTKYVGAFTFFSIGVPVMIDLWSLLDVKRRQGALTLPEFGRHLGARVIGLIIVPFLIYLFWFQVHFAILSRSGPGDEFMSPEFQETLGDNIMMSQSVGVQYFDSLTIRHKETKTYLHSHTEHYPLRYDDGRISSQGQQVTGYPHNDTNNQWQVIPLRGEVMRGKPVRNNEVFKLYHLGTSTYLLSHDVASPYFPTNQEFTTVSEADAIGDRHNDTLFQIRVDRAKPTAEVRTKASQFKLIHNPSRVAMWTHTSPLPEWAFQQAEICGNKNVAQTSNTWYFEDVPSLPRDDDRWKQETRKIKTMPFLKKYIELQRAMFLHNNALTASHPYASHPIEWPYLLRGVSFWTDNETRQQIYFLGNPIGWWLASTLLAVFAGLLGADQVSLRRGIDALDERTRGRLYNSTGFFFLLWLAHYLPFFIMGRQLFLHHYLPAHLASALVAGALLEFVFSVEPADGNIFDAFNPRSTAALTTDGNKSKTALAGANVPGTSNTPSTLTSTNPSTSKTAELQRRRPMSQRLVGQSLWASWIALAVILAAIIYGFLFYAPLTYGKPGLSIEDVNRRKWLGYDLHFAK